MNCRSLLVAPFLFLSILASAADVPANKGGHEHDHPQDLQFAIRSVASGKWSGCRCLLRVGCSNGDPDVNSIDPRRNNKD